MSTISSSITNVCQPLVMAPGDDALEMGISDSWKWWVGFRSPQFLAGAGKKYMPPGYNPQPGLSAWRVLQLDHVLDNHHSHMLGFTYCLTSCRFQSRFLPPCSMFHGINSKNNTFNLCLIAQNILCNEYFLLFHSSLSCTQFLNCMCKLKTYNLKWKTDTLGVLREPTI